MQWRRNGDLHKHVQSSSQCGHAHLAIVRASTWSMYHNVMTTDAAAAAATSPPRHHAVAFSPARLAIRQPRAPASDNWPSVRRSSPRWRAVSAAWPADDNRATERPTARTGRHVVVNARHAVTAPTHAPLFGASARFRHVDYKGARRSPGEHHHP